MINNFNKKNTKKAFFCCKSTVYISQKRKKGKKKRGIKNIDTEGKKEGNRKKDKKR